MDATSEIQRIIAEGGIRAVYQPIVELSSGNVVGYEALARGPAGSEFEQPNRLFDAARKAGLVAELDWACQTSALSGALDAGLDSGSYLFLNVDPLAMVQECPPELETLYVQAANRLSLVIEVTERELDADPAALICRVASLRHRGFSVAIDDIGANPMSLAFLPMLAPDVIKLDMGLIQDAGRDAWAEVGAAVGADAELRGATILGEGIETDEHLQRAIVLGATLGQGWLFGRPGELRSDVAPTDLRFTAATLGIAESPWAVVENDKTAIAPKHMLLPISHHIEQMAHTAADRPVVLGSFQRAEYFTPATSRRYQALAEVSSFVAAVGAGMSSTPAPGVRGAAIRATDRLANEWVALTISPYRASAVIGVDLGDSGAERDRRFAYVVTHDRATVGAAARSMMQYLSPRRQRELLGDQF